VLRKTWHTTRYRAETVLLNAITWAVDAFFRSALWTILLLLFNEWIRGEFTFVVNHERTLLILTTPLACTKVTLRTIQVLKLLGSRHEIQVL
jgi:hypothetical protein